MRPPRWDRMPPIKAVMTPFPHAVDIGDPVSRAEAMMAEFGVHHLPVLDDGRIAGVIAVRDIRLAREPAAARGRSDDRRVRDLCESDPYIVELARPLDRVLVHMAGHNRDCALVVKSGRLAGIFTLTDACRCYGELLRWLYPQDGGDAA